MTPWLRAAAQLPVTYLTLAALLVLPFALTQASSASITHYNTTTYQSDLNFAAGLCCGLASLTVCAWVAPWLRREAPLRRLRAHAEISTLLTLGGLLLIAFTHPGEASPPRQIVAATALTVAQVLIASAVQRRLSGMLAAFLLVAWFVPTLLHPAQALGLPFTWDASGELPHFGPTCLAAIASILGLLCSSVLIALRPGDPR